MKKLESQMAVTNLLIENVLSWVRDQMTGVTIAMEPVSLEELVNEHISLYSTAAAEKKVTLVSEINGAYTVQADRQVLSLVLRNLISNAIKYSYANGTIRIQADQNDKGTVSLSVSDNGTGMSPSTLAKLLKNEEGLASELGTGNEMGTGLGLMVSREYLTKMGSELSVESLPGKGSIFRLELKKADHP